MREVPRTNVHQYVDGDRTFGEISPDALAEINNDYDALNETMRIPISG